MKTVRIIHAQKKVHFILAHKFVLPYEKNFLALMERIQKNEPCIFLIAEADEEGIVLLRGVFSYTSGKAFTPCIPEFTGAVVNLLKSFLCEHKVFCLTGTACGVKKIAELIKDVRGELPQDKRELILMRMEKNKEEGGALNLNESAAASKDAAVIKKAHIPNVTGGLCGETGVAYTSERDISLKNLKIIKCSKSHVNDLMPLHLSFVKEEVLPPYYESSKAFEFLNLERNLKNHVVLAVKNDAAFVAKAQTNAVTKNYMQIGGVYTRKEFRGNGFARALVCRIALLALKKKKTCMLYVRRDNAPALRCYENAGFVRDGELLMYYF